MIRIKSIFPAQGPITGDTRVLVRGGPFSKWEDDYKFPKCRFGDADNSTEVSAEYVTCPHN